MSNSTAWFLLQTEHKSWGRNCRRRIHAAKLHDVLHGTPRVKFVCGYGGLHVIKADEAVVIA